MIQTGLEAFKESSARWASQGLDRIHPPTGTVWKFGFETRTHDKKPEPQWGYQIGESAFAIVTRKGTEWEWCVMGWWSSTPRHKASSESGAMQAALDAAGWGRK